MEADNEPTCGCRFVNAGNAFVYEPCSATCDNYAYVIEQARKTGKPVATLDLRKPESRRMAPAACPYCGTANDAFASDDHRKRPKPGNVSVCVHCVKPSIFTENGVRKPTDVEQRSLDNDEGVQTMLRTIELMKRRPK